MLARDPKAEVVQDAIQNEEAEAYDADEDGSRKAQEVPQSSPPEANDRILYETAEVPVAIPVGGDVPQAHVLHEISCLVYLGALEFFRGTDQRVEASITRIVDACRCYERTRDACHWLEATLREAAETKGVICRHFASPDTNFKMVERCEIICMDGKVDCAHCGVPDNLESHYQPSEEERKIISNAVFEKKELRFERGKLDNVDRIARAEVIADILECVSGLVHPTIDENLGRGCHDWLERVLRKALSTDDSTAIRLCSAFATDKMKKDCLIDCLDEDGFPEDDQGFCASCRVKRSSTPVRSGSRRRSRGPSRRRKKRTPDGPEKPPQ